MSRFCQNNYMDGFSEIRKGLPNPRDVSNSLGDIALSPGGTP